jgi:hypothetical protein
VSTDEPDLDSLLSAARERGGRFARTREELLARLDGAVCRGSVGGVRVIEPVSGGSVWIRQIEVDALIASGSLAEVSEGDETRLVRTDLGGTMAPGLLEE